MSVAAELGGLRAEGCGIVDFLRIVLSTSAFHTFVVLPRYSVYKTVLISPLFFGVKGRSRELNTTVSGVVVT